MCRYGWFYVSEETAQTAKTAHIHTRTRSVLCNVLLKKQPDLLPFYDFSLYFLIYLLYETGDRLHERLLRDRLRPDDHGCRR